MNSSRARVWRTVLTAAHTIPRSSSYNSRAVAMSLRPFSAPWPDADVAPWVPPTTAGLALLLGTCATLLVAHSRASQLRFNVRPVCARSAWRATVAVGADAHGSCARRRRWPDWLQLRLRRPARWRWRMPDAAARCRRCRRARSRSSRRRRCAMHRHSACGSFARCSQLLLTRARSAAAAGFGGVRHRTRYLFHARAAAADGSEAGVSRRRFQKQARAATRAGVPARRPPRRGGERLVLVRRRGHHGGHRYAQAGRPRPRT